MGVLASVCVSASGCVGCVVLCCVVMRFVLLELLWFMDAMCFAWPDHVVRCGRFCFE